VARELRFLEPGLRDLPIEMMYNGVPAHRQDLAQRHARRARMREYARNLLGFTPDYVFAHVARPVLSKGIWRDLGVLHELEPILARAGQSAVSLMLGTLAGQRRTKDVLHMERIYGWPVHHMPGYPDLCNGEETVEALFADFNRHHEHVRAVLVNQFGWERKLCGLRMPEGMTFADIRQGTDVEFGLSIYEPFGISQLEPLAFGAICLVSNVCGCLSFAQHASGGTLPPNVLVGDFTRRPGGEPMPALQLGRAQRDAVESAEYRRLASELAQRLPRTDADLAALLSSGWALGERLDWEHVVRELFLPALERLCRQDILDSLPV
jgi:glycosyltransferase involved in cell wall biosynthesis